VADDDSDRASAFGYYLTTQLPSTTDSQCSVRWGLQPHCGAHSQAQVGTRSRASGAACLDASFSLLLPWHSCAFGAAALSISIDLPAIAPSLDVRRRIAQERVPTTLRQRLLKTSEPGASSLKRSLHDRKGAPQSKTALSN
jgi:hypothetical protein